MEHYLLYRADFLKLVSVDDADKCLWKTSFPTCQYLLIQITWVFLLFLGSKVGALEYAEGIQNVLKIPFIPKE